MSDSPASTRRQAATVRLPAVADDGARPVAPREVVENAARGDSAAFDQLVRLHQDNVARLVQRLLGWPSEVDDVVQDVFVDVLKHLPRFDGRSSFATWLTRIAINRVRSHQRRVWVRRLFLRKLRTQGDTQASESASRAAETSETIIQVHAAIRQLKPRDREIIVLRYLEEQTPAAISETLNIARGTVDVRLLRAKQRLEEILKPVLDKQ